MKKPLPNRVVSAILAITIVFCVVLHVSGEPLDSDGGRFADGSTNVGIFINGAGVGGAANVADLKCPRVCSCTAQTVDCSHRGLQQIPRRIPLDTERL